MFVYILARASERLRSVGGAQRQREITPLAPSSVNINNEIYF